MRCLVMEDEADTARYIVRMCTPRSLGGLEVDPLTRALVIEEISGHDTAAGWTLANPLDWA